MLSRATFKSPLSDGQQACENHHSVACSTGSPNLTTSSEHQHCAPDIMEPLIDDDTPSTATGTPGIHHVLSFIHGDLGSPLEETPQLRRALSQVGADARCGCLYTLLAQVFDWTDFDVFELDEASQGRPLYALAMAIFTEEGLLVRSKPGYNRIWSHYMRHRMAGRLIVHPLISTCGLSSRGTAAKTRTTTRSTPLTSPKPWR